MKKAILSFLSAAALVCLWETVALSQETFSFYGLKFGMTRDEIQQVYPSIALTQAEELQQIYTPLAQNQVTDPGHGMIILELFFDRERLLMELRASYQRPADKLQEAALRRALREKFVSPTRAQHPGIGVNTDEFQNRGAITLIFRSDGIREKNIEHYKQEYLKAME